MKKTLVFRSLLGAVIGIAISYVITIAISLALGDGNYYPVVPELSAALGTEINAVLVQLICSAVYGAVFAAASVIWEVESWSILRMTVTHMLAISLPTFPIAWLLRWMPRDLGGAALYFAIFFLIYAAIWLTQYATTKARLRELNEKLKP